MWNSQSIYLSLCSLSRRPRDVFVDRRGTVVIWVVECGSGSARGSRRGDDSV